MENNFEVYVRQCIKELYDNSSELWREVHAIKELMKKKIEQMEEHFQKVDGKLRILFKEWNR